MLLCYITDRRAFGADPQAGGARLLHKISEAAAAGVDYIQLREKDLTARELEALAREAVAAVRVAGSRARLLINGRADVAIAARADGVHLPEGDMAASEARSLLVQAGMPRPVVSAACHTADAVALAESHGADLALFAPVFSSGEKSAAGLEALAAASRAAVASMPVLALGGVTLENAAACLQAGAAGVAGMRLFQENDVAAVVETLRRLG